MSDHSSNAPTSADRAELEQTLACVEQMIRDFENMTAQARMANAEMTVQVEQLGSQGNGRATTLVVISSSPDFQELAQSLARQKVLQKELVDAAAAYSQELSRWAEDLERKEQSMTIVTGANGVLPGETFSSPPAFEDSETVLGAIAGTGADMVADTLLAFGNMAGPAKAPYNPVDAAFGYQDAFWKMLGYKSRPIGAQSSAENAQLDDALESALFGLYGQGVFAGDSPKVAGRESQAVIVKLSSNLQDETLSDVQVRDWYNATKIVRAYIINQMRAAEVPDEDIAHEAFELRNAARYKARDLMANRERAADLETENPNFAWDEIVEKYNGDYKIITDKSLESDEEIDRLIDQMRHRERGDK